MKCLCNKTMKVNKRDFKGEFWGIKYSVIRYTHICDICNYKIMESKTKEK